MRNPADDSPQVWAEHLRDCVADMDPDVRHIVSYLTAADCDELAARMDDLTEALRIIKRLSPSEPLHMDEDVRALLAKYEEEVDSE